MQNYSMKQIQDKILETMIHVDKLCRDNNIDYYIMGGTAIGAVRHQGFIPWDDDLDIFMTPENYEKFKSVFSTQNDSKFVIQEWRLGNSLLEYAKVRMNGTTFIEANFKENRDMHHGVYIDIMILHKCPKNRIAKSLLFLFSRYVQVQALAERNWIPKSKLQAFILKFIRLLPKHFMSGFCYRQIYKYDKQGENMSKIYLPQLFHAHTKDLSSINIQDTDLFRCPICLKVFYEFHISTQEITDVYIWSKEIRKRIFEET